MIDTEREVIERLEYLSILAPSGFAIVLHMRLSRPRFLFQNYPEEWVDIYSREVLVLQDPTVRWAMTCGVGIRTWGSFKGEDRAGLLDRAARYGLKFGATWAAQRDGLPSFGGIARKDRDFTEAELLRAGEILDEIHDMTASLDEFEDEGEGKLRDISVFLTQEKAAA